MLPIVVRQSIDSRAIQNNHRPMPFIWEIGRCAADDRSTSIFCRKYLKIVRSSSEYPSMIGRFTHYQKKNGIGQALADACESRLKHSDCSSIVFILNLYVRLSYGILREHFHTAVTKYRCQIVGLFDCLFICASNLVRRAPPIHVIPNLPDTWYKS